MMADLPLRFARDFEKLKSDLGSFQAPDLKLLLLLEYWPGLEKHKNEPEYQTYFDEFISLFHPVVRDENLVDLTIDELERLKVATLEIKDFASSDRLKAVLTEGFREVGINLAKKFFYVAAFKEALSICYGLLEENPEPDIFLEELRGQNEFDIFRSLCEKARVSNVKLHHLLQPILIEWEAEKESVDYDVASCLFVEKDSLGRGLRGRLRHLGGKVELSGKSARTDEITFENQIKTPDDPFVGVAYDAMKAVKEVFREEGTASKADASYHGHFSIKNSKHSFTGDSIGLAVGLLTYTQLLKPEVTRQDRYLSSEVAFTGGVDTHGNLTAVDDDSLRLKIERAFFSPIKFLVLPEANFETAKAHLESLKKKYPGRRLQIVSAERLSDVIENRNVLRSEKVCMGRFVAKKTVKYGRSVRVQVPILLGMLYVLICLLYPQACILFDRNPQYVKLTKTGFEALNADSVALWSVEYECESIEASSVYEIGDIDNDGKNEIAFAPTAPTVSPCKSDGNIYVYEHNGRQLFHRYCAILGEYPGDTLVTHPYYISHVKFVRTFDSTIILTAVNESYPARAHIRFWNTTGDSIGWYINSGAVKIDDTHFAVLEDLGFAFSGINNRVGSACLFVLPVGSIYGVSPPYFDSVYSLENVRRGNQLYYLSFPPSDINSFLQQKYNSTHELRFVSDKTIETVTSECGGAMSCFIDYYLNENLRVTDVKLADDFLEIRQMMAKDGLMPDMDLMYTASLRDNVAYWVHTGWITEGELRAAENK